MKNSLDFYKAIPEYNAMLKNMSREEIENSFSSSLSFGTSGVRAIMGVGSNKMNVFNVIKIVSAICLYASSEDKNRILICYDTRKNSKEYGELCFKVCKHFGLNVQIFKNSTPTPVLSFAVKTLKFDLGINITASHNPKEYNGIKIVDSTGAQINEKISNEIAKDINKVNEFSIYEKLGNYKLKYISDGIKKRYLKFCLKNVNSYKKPKIKVLYTALNGTGTEYFVHLLNKRNFKYRLVEKQNVIDENFTTCPSPNPELEVAYAEALKVQKGEDIIVATDPDSDRLGVMCKNADGYRLLTGNEIGKIFTYFLINNSDLKENKFIVSTVVTSRAIQKLAKLSNVDYYETLTGFKNLAKKVDEKAKNKIPLIFFEESCGYEVTGFLRDKDGLTAGLLMVEIANYYANKNKSIIDVLSKINKLTENTIERSKSYFIDSIEINKILENLRNDKYKTLNVLDKIDYLQSRKTKLPKSNFLKLVLKDGEVIIRPSGTEPKLKVYAFSSGESLDIANNKLEKIFNAIEKKILKIKE